jgi:hypothetical protein
VALAGAWKKADYCENNPNRLAWIPVYATLHVAYYVRFGHPQLRYFYPLFFPVLLFAAAIASEAGRRRIRAGRGGLA